MDDHTKAEAIRIAHQRLIDSGWRFSLDDIGSNAAKIINAMYRNLESRE